MRVLAWVVFVWIALLLVILCCVFRLYTVTKSLDDMVIVLIEQTWTLQLLMQRSFGGKELASQWSDDALAVRGPKGELLIRRFTLIKQWAASFHGVITEVQDHIKQRIDEIDTNLECYYVNLKPITLLTLKMIHDLYHGDFASCSNITMSIIQKLRLL